MPTLGSRYGELRGAVLEPGESSEKKLADDPQRQAWALSLLQAVSRELPARLGLDGSSAAAWHKGDAGLTDTGTKTAASADVGPKAGPLGPGNSTQNGPSDTVALEVDGGDLGSILVSVNRSDAGLRVVIRADNPYSQSVLELERQALLQNLRSGGLEISEVKVTARGRAGTPFAQGKHESNVRGAASKIRAYQSRQANDAEADEDGLDLIG